MQNLFLKRGVEQSMETKMKNLITEKKAIEDVLESLSGSMRSFALEEIRNLDFEIEMGNRAQQHNEPIIVAHPASLAKHTLQYA